MSQNQSLLYNSSPPPYNPQHDPAGKGLPAYSYQAIPYGAPNNHAVIVTTQPTAAPVVYHSYGTNDHFLILSIVMTFLCFICGTWCALFCTVPAIIFAINAQDAALHGDMIGMARNRRIAAILNLIGLITFMIVMVILVITVVSVNVSIASSCYSYYDNYYEYYYSC